MQKFLRTYLTCQYQLLEMVKSNGSLLRDGISLMLCLQNQHTAVTYVNLTVTLSHVYCNKYHFQCNGAFMNPFNSSVLLELSQKNVHACIVQIKKKFSYLELQREYYRIQCCRQRCPDCRGFPRSPRRSRRTCEPSKWATSPSYFLIRLRRICDRSGRLCSKISG